MCAGGERGRGSLGNGQGGDGKDYNGDEDVNDALHVQNLLSGLQAGWIAGSG